MSLSASALQEQLFPADGKRYFSRPQSRNPIRGATEKTAEFFLFAGHTRLPFMTAHLTGIVKFSGCFHIYCLQPAGGRPQFFQDNMATIVLD